MPPSETTLPETRSGEERRAPWGRRILLALVAALAAAEVGARGWDAARGVGGESYVPREPSTGMYVPHPYLGVVLRPGFERPGPFSVTVTSLGVRGPERPLEKLPGTYRILCLGGSTTFGTAVSADDQAYPAQLERILNRLPERRFEYEVWNGGVPGYTTSESLINYALRLGELDHDAVIVYHAVNDARPIQTAGFRSDYSHFRTSWRSFVVSDAERALMRASRIYAWIASPASHDEGLGDHLIAPDFERRLVPAERGVVEEGVATFRRNLAHIATLVRARGATPLFSTFATCPARWRPEDLSLQAAVDRLNEEIRELGDELDVPVLEIASLEDPRVFSDWVHLDDAGSNLHARRVALQARERGWLGLPGPGTPADQDENAKR